MIQYRFGDKITQAYAYKELLKQGIDQDDIIKLNTNMFYDIIVLDAKIRPSDNQFMEFIISSS